MFYFSLSLLVEYLVLRICYVTDADLICTDFFYRHSWDKFVAAPGAVMSSSIPVGWVLPSNPSTEKWESLLTDNSKNFKI